MTFFRRNSNKEIDRVRKCESILLPPYGVTEYMQTFRYEIAPVSQQATIKQKPNRQMRYIVILVHRAAYSNEVIIWVLLY